MSLQIIDRNGWGARPPKWFSALAGSKGVFIHYNGGPVPGDVLSGDRDSVALFLRNTQNYHMNGQGWPDIAYSFCVDSVGRCWQLRGWNVTQAATLNWNHQSHSIFLPIGGDQAPTEAQMATCRTLIAEHNRRYGNGFVKGHQEAPNSTSCPGRPTMDLIRAGRFAPSSGDVFVPPSPAGVDPNVNKPVMMREPDGTVWMYYGGTPWRVHVKSVQDVETFQFFGIELKGVDRTQAAFFRRYSQAVKCK